MAIYFSVPLDRRATGRDQGIAESAISMDAKALQSAIL